MIFAREIFQKLRPRMILFWGEGAEGSSFNCFLPKTLVVAASEAAAVDFIVKMTLRFFPTAIMVIYVFIKISTL